MKIYLYRKLGNIENEEMLRERQRTKDKMGFRRQIDSFEHQRDEIVKEWIKDN